MTHEIQSAVASLLREASAAHGVYEENELNGVYDRNWPDWYAAYLAQHGLGDILHTTITVEQLSRLLRLCDEAYNREQPGMSWPEYYAQRIAVTFGEGMDRAA
jgi:hypothetical protein